jgi:hypothetical protein
MHHSFAGKIQMSNALKEVREKSTLRGCHCRANRSSFCRQALDAHNLLWPRSDVFLTPTAPQSAHRSWWVTRRDREELTENDQDDEDDEEI